MKEYGIYVKNGNALPYMLNIFDDIDLAKIKLYDMISLESLRQRPYLVDNDFYKNAHNMETCRLMYLCIKEREVTEWKKYSEKENIKEKIQNDKKIFFINEYRIQK